MNCYVHPDKEAVGVCTSCTKPICSECKVEVAGKLVCTNCLAEGKGIAQVPAAGTALKSKGTALVAEIAGGLFGIFGLGWIIAGRSETGVFWLVGMLIWELVAVGISLITGGILCIVTIPINLAAVAASAYNLNNYMNQHPDQFTA